MGRLVRAAVPIVLTFAGLAAVAVGVAGVSREPAADGPLAPYDRAYACASATPRQACGTWLGGVVQSASFPGAERADVVVEPAGHQAAPFVIRVGRDAERISTHFGELRDVLRPGLAVDVLFWNTKPEVLSIEGVGELLSITNPRAVAARRTTDVTTLLVGAGATVTGGAWVIWSARGRRKGQR